MLDWRMGGRVLVTPHGLRPYLVAISGFQFDAPTCASHLHLPADLHFVVLDLSQRQAAGTAGSSGLWVTVLRVQAHARQVLTGPGRFRVAVASLTPLGMLAAFNLRGSDDAGSGRPQPLEAFCDLADALQLARLLGTAKSASQHVHVFARWLEHRIMTARALPSSAVRAGRAAALLMQQKGPVADIGGTARAAGVSLRQLERDFRSSIGISPSEYAVIVKFQKAAAAVSSGVSLSHAAVDHGFVDQPHMTRAIRRLGGITPLDLAREGSRPGRHRMRQGLGGRVILFDAPRDLAPAVRSP